MYLNNLSKDKIGRILNNVLVDIRRDEDWLESFPSVFGYEPFLPECIEKAIKHPEALYSDDHAIASKAILHSSFHPMMQQIVEAIIYTNLHWERRDMEDGVDQPGISFARVLALHDIGYIQLYVDFLLSLGDKYTEKCQSFDILQIIHKWGWNKDTYCLMLTYWFLSKECKYKVLDYLMTSVFALSEDFNNNDFCTALRIFLSKVSLNDKDLSGKYLDEYEKLLKQYILKNNEQMISSFITYYLESINNVNSDEEMTSDLHDQILEKDDIPEI